MGDKQGFLARYDWLQEKDRIKVTRVLYPKEMAGREVLESRPDKDQGVFEDIDDSCLYLRLDDGSLENPLLDTIRNLEKLD